MQKKIAARALTIDSLTTVLESLDAVQFADGSWAVLQEVEGQEVWTEITVKAKAPTFDPFVAAEDWKDDKAVKAQAAADKAKEKAAKIARDQAAREAKRKAKEGE